MTVQASDPLAEVEDALGGVRQRWRAHVRVCGRERRAAKAAMGLRGTGTQRELRQRSLIRTNSSILDLTYLGT